MSDQFVKYRDSLCDTAAVGVASVLNALNIVSFRTWMTAAVAVLILSCAGAAAESSQTGPLVRGFVGNPRGGFRSPWHTHAGWVPLAGVRQTKAVAEMVWQSDKTPKEIHADRVTLAWSGAMGLGSGAGTFTISVNGHAVVNFDVVSESTEFPCRNRNCRFLYDAIFTYDNAIDSSGHFYLTVPAAWIKPGQCATLKVKGSDSVRNAWFALMPASEPLPQVPNRAWKPFQRVNAPQPWNVPTTGRRGELCLVSRPVLRSRHLHAHRATRRPVRSGRLAQRATDVCQRPPHTGHALRGQQFGVWLAGGRTCGCLRFRYSARQSLEEDRLPIVTTDWQWRDLHIRQRCFARPLRGTEYHSGLESTLAWAVFEITNRAPRSLDLAFVAMLPGSENDIVRNLAWRDGVLFENQSARCSLRAPAGFAVEFRAAPPAAALSGRKPGGLLRSGVLFNAVVARGRIEAGSTIMLTMNRVFDFPARCIGVLARTKSPQRS